MNVECQSGQRCPSNKFVLFTFYIMILKIIRINDGQSILEVADHKMCLGTQKIGLQLSNNFKKFKFQFFFDFFGPFFAAFLSNYRVFIIYYID